jgi:hypothetical protein
MSGHNLLFGFHWRVERFWRVLFGRENLRSEIGEIGSHCRVGYTMEC